MSPPSRARLLALAFAANAPAHAHAQEGDGVYGRFDAATSFALAAGVAYADGGRVAPVVDARVRFLESGGLALTLHGEHPGAYRVFTGVELRPLFPALFLQSMSTGRPLLDLFIQSLGIELGVDLPLERPMPLAFAWGMSLELPFVSPERFAHGMGLRLGFRRSTFFGDARPNVGDAGDVSRFGFYALLSIGLDVGSDLAGWEPVRHRHR